MKVIPDQNNLCTLLCTLTTLTLTEADKTMYFQTVEKPMQMKPNISDMCVTMLHWWHHLDHHSVFPPIQVPVQWWAEFSRQSWHQLFPQHRITNQNQSNQNNDHMIQNSLKNLSKQQKILGERCSSRTGEFLFVLQPVLCFLCYWSA